MRKIPGSAGKNAEGFGMLCVLYCGKVPQNNCHREPAPTLVWRSPKKNRRPIGRRLRYYWAVQTKV